VVGSQGIHGETLRQRTAHGLLRALYATPHPLTEEVELLASKGTDNLLICHSLELLAEIPSWSATGIMHENPRMTDGVVLQSIAPHVRFTTLMIEYRGQVSRISLDWVTMYPKNVAENIPADVLREIRNEVEDG
jgi:hypothetical protein